MRLFISSTFTNCIDKLTYQWLPQIIYELSQELAILKQTEKQFNEQYIKLIHKEFLHNFPMINSKSIEKLRQHFNDEYLPLENLDKISRRAFLWPNNSQLTMDIHFYEQYQFFRARYIDIQHQLFILHGGLKLLEPSLQDSNNISLQTLDLLLEQIQSIQNGFINSYLIGSNSWLDLTKRRLRNYLHNIFRFPQITNFRQSIKLFERLKWYHLIDNVERLIFNLIILHDMLDKNMTSIRKFQMLNDKGKDIWIDNKMII